jgi:branched-chain amino acid transport system ATP-binding protein
MLEVNAIKVFYGAFQALNRIDLKVGNEETVGLFGPNGHGKTTILKTISGLLRPAEGEIRFEGKRIDTLSPPEIASMGIVHVPQGRHLFPYLSVKENLFLGASCTKESWKEREQRLKDVYKIFPRLKERERQKCAALSGGERQMAAIGRGLMSEAKLLMLDEPLEGLAPVLMGELREKIREIREETKSSMIVVDENVNFVTELADRVYLIEHGEVRVEGRKDEIMNLDEIKHAYLGHL